MDISKRSFILSLLAIPSTKAYSCTGPDEVIEQYGKNKPNKQHIGASMEEFLNQTYGKDNWRFDDNLFIESPDQIENAAKINFKTGIKEIAATEGYTVLSIFAEEYIPVIYRGIRSREKRVFAIAKYKFNEGALPYIANWLNLSSANEARLFCVFTTNAEKPARVVMQPSIVYTGGHCGITLYSKD